MKPLLLLLLSLYYDNNNKPMGELGLAWGWGVGGHFDVFSIYVFMAPVAPGPMVQARGAPGIHV